MSILDWRVEDTAVAIVDIETTGLHPGADRLVEISVVRAEPGSGPELVLDTLLNPQRRVSATEIHGITDEDVKDAPTFDDIAGELARAIAESVLAAYNVYFDVRFLRDEFRRVGFREVPPHLCLMYMRPMLGLGRKCCLSDACRAHGVHHGEAHRAAADALASAALWALYRDRIAERGLRTFADLAELREYKFLESWESPPLAAGLVASLPPAVRLKPRSEIGLAAELDRVAARPRSRISELHEYWDALTTAVADLELTEEEVGDLARKREQFQLTVEELRALHGRVFAAMLEETIEDSSVTDAEWLSLRRLHECLRHLGWAPGM